MLTELITPQNNEVLPESVVEELTSTALEYIGAHYDNPPDPRQKLPYHGSFHTSRVMERIRRILEVIKAVDPTLVSDRDLQLGAIAAAYHDIVQQWGEMTVDMADKYELMMKRKTGLNEKASALMARARMVETNAREGVDYFTLEDMKKVTDAILGTIPGYDMELKTVIQPNVTEDSSIITKALALADLAGPAMDGPDIYLWEGNNLFYELNLDVRYAHIMGLPKMNAHKESIKRRALDWTESQVNFAQGRSARFFQTELLWIPEQVRGAVEVEFSFYDESITAAKMALERRSEMSCDEILDEMGNEL